MRAYRDRWVAVEEIERQELKAASMEERWQQLKAIIGLAIGLGIFPLDQNEMEEYLLWAVIKDMTSTQNL